MFVRAHKLGESLLPVLRGGKTTATIVATFGRLPNYRTTMRLSYNHCHRLPCVQYTMNKPECRNRAVGEPPYTQGLVKLNSSVIIHTAVFFVFSLRCFEIFHCCIQGIYSIPSSLVSRSSLHTCWAMPRITSSASWPLSNRPTRSFANHTAGAAGTVRAYHIIQQPSGDTPLQQKRQLLPPQQREHARTPP